MGLGRVRNMSEEKEERKSDRKERDELGMRGRHSVAFTVHFFIMLALYHHIPDSGYIPLGLSSLMYRLRHQLRASQAICPANINIISISRFDHIKVA